MNQGNSNDTRYRTVVCVSPEHPCLPGHFPGHQLVPGVVMLEFVAQALRAWRHQRLTRVREAKFMAPWHPGEIAELNLQGHSGHVRFELHCEGKVLARGVIEGAS